ncbi:MAG: Coenzyme F420 hydrogenase/dehydrogenase, beta subunit C-terminal domain [Bacteroidales bacterium]|nr:Coenzyme F420 hydrogenase/dehydrogenase, beta subunit C-terminal domain [Bacteroidales bacterium]
MNKNNNTIEILSKNQCTGCMLCGDVCIKSSIIFKEDDEGFLYPSIDKDTCIECGACVKTCPALNPQKHTTSPTSYAAYANDINARNIGSSGGIFGLVAEEILNKGGRIWGAAFDEKIHLIHSKADNIEELKPLLKSKYIQSNLKGVYSQIKKDLNEGLFTLFCGTPCQVNALRNYVGENENLLLVDFVCHGVPNQILFDKTIKWYEKKHNVEVSWFQFRYKSSKVKHPQSYAIQHKGDKKIRIGLHYQFPYYFGFQKYITLRPSCYQCKWACSERVGDITLGDYWGVEKYIPELCAKDGVSMIICNSQKGLNTFNQLVNNNIIVAKPLTIDNAISENGCLSKPSIEKKERNEFFRHLKEWPFDDVVKIHLTPRKKWIFDLYYAIPKFIRNIVRKLMDKRMRYE